MMLHLFAALALTPEQQQQDFDFFWQEAEHHPALTLYTSREELEEAKANARAKLDVERDPYSFWGILAQSASLIGCGHSGLSPTPAMAGQGPEGAVAFPLDLVVVDDTLYVDPRTDAEPGRIVSIEGVPHDELLALLRGMISSDARSTPWQDDQIDRMPGLLVPAVVGPHARYHVEIEQDGRVRSVDVGQEDASTRAGGAPTADERISRIPIEGGFVVRATFDEFKSMGHTRRTVTRPILRAVKQGASGVILDLRRNGGGDWTPATDLLAHFDPDPWPTYSARLITRGLAERRGWSEGGAWTLREDGLVDMGYGPLAVQEPRAPLVQVPLVVLTAGHTFSTAADVAAFVKREGMGTVVGTPSGGSARIQTSQNTRRGLLPYSHIEYAIALHRSDLADPDGVLTSGVGVIPDILVAPTLADLAEGRDPVLEAALAVFGP